MNWTFWQYLTASVLTFGLIAWLTAKACCGMQSAWRRWQVRREMGKVVVGIAAERLHKGDAITVGADGRIYRSPSQAEIQRASETLQRQTRDVLRRAEDVLRRAELDGLATAQDKRERRIVH